MNRILTPLLLALSLCLAGAESDAQDETKANQRVADPASFIGINCGKSGAHDHKQGIDQYFLKRNIATLNLASELRLGWARCGGGPEQWYAGGKPLPDNFDIVVGHANKLGIQVYLFLEYRGDINKQSMTDFDWKRTGREFAEHFGKRVGCYGILNEVDHVRSPHDPAEVFAAVRDFAAGVKSVDRSLLVSTPAIGGTPMEVDRADRFLKSMRPLINKGMVDVLNLHSYHDSKPNKPHFSSIDGSSDWAPSRNFLRAKKVAGIKTPVRFSAGEFNYRNWTGTDADRGRGFMTTLWDQLMVVGAQENGQRVGLFSMPYNVADSRQERQTTMALNFDWRENGGYEWIPNEKGRVLRDQLFATRGMQFVSCAPHQSGLAVLQGSGKTAWVWHNRKAFSKLASQTEVTITGIPAGATELRMLTHESSLKNPAKKFPLNKQSSIKFRLADLPAEQSLLFITNSDRPSGSESMH